MTNNVSARPQITGFAATVRRARWLAFLAVLGPGLVVMLADTDVGSIVTAAQSGTQWGYRLLLLQLILIPILFVVQELTVRLGIFTGKGYTELIRTTFGPLWAWVSVVGLGVAVIGAIVTEFAGIAGVGEVFGLPRWLMLLAACGFLLGVVWTGTYRRVERIAIALGLFELAFVIVAIAAHPDIHVMAENMTHIPLTDNSYLFLVLANIGAVIMPWMIFYQQSAVVEKGLQPENYRAARLDTAVGAVVTQLIMIAVLISAAATIGTTAPNSSLNTVGQIVNALVPFLGTAMGKVAFSLGIIGAGMVSAIVVSLSMAWAFGEVTGHTHSVAHRSREVPVFYVVYSAGVISGAIMVAIIPDLVMLSIAVQVMNALLLPLILGFLVALAIKVLPPKYRLRGAYRVLIISLAVAIAIIGLFAGLQQVGAMRF